MDEDNAFPPEALQLHLEGFEGPLDLLLDLARGQQVELAKISFVTLVDQYVVAVSAADRVNLPRAAEWLVIAAWLSGPSMTPASCASGIPVDQQPSPLPFSERSCCV